MTEQSSSRSPFIPYGITLPSVSFFRRKKRLLLTLIISGIVSSLVSLYFVLPWLVTSFELQGVQVEFTESGRPVWYEFSLGSIVPSTGPRGFAGAPLHVLEAVALGEKGDHVVLGSVANQKGIVLGLLHADNSFLPIINTETDKVHLAVRADGVVAFAETLPAPQVDTSEHPFSAPAPAVPKSEDLQKREPIRLPRGADPHALPPIPKLRESVVPTRIALFNLNDSKIVVTYPSNGRAPRFAQDGSLVALGPAGLIRINTTSGEVSVLLPRPEAANAGNDISTDATVVALLAAGKTDFYRMGDTSPLELEHLGSVPDRYRALHVVGNAYLFSPTAGYARVSRIDAGSATDNGVLFPFRSRSE